MRSLDFRGKPAKDDETYRQYQRRNSFGLDLERKIHRIFQKDFYEKDVSDGFSTLPRATASAWKDPLENPLENITVVDHVTRSPIHLGSLVNSFYALCWTKRTNPTHSDWENFSHQKEAIRVTTSVGKLMDRVMRLDDSGYMHRSWLIDVEYKDPYFIRMMQNPTGVYGRVESTGALLALSAAVVRQDFCDEEEVRLLFDNSIIPAWSEVIACNDSDLNSSH